MAKSPSIILTEIDDSSYAITTSDTVLAIVGYATKGKIGETVRVTSRNEFLDKFGPPPTNAPWSSLAVYRAFNQGDQILFKRVAEESGSNQAVASERCITNASGATNGYQEFSQTVPVAFASYTAQEIYDFKAEIDNSGIIRDVYIVSPISGDWTLADIATQINTQITSATSGFQEYEVQTAPTIPSPEFTGYGTEYRFKAGIDGASISGGADLSVILNPGDTLADIATDIATAMTGGSRGYQKWSASGAITEATPVGLAVGTDYGFRINLANGGDEEVIVIGTTAMTYGDLVDAIQAQLDAHTPSPILATAHFDTDGTGNIRIQAMADGAPAAGSSVAITDDAPIEAPAGGGLFNALDAGGSFAASVDGVDGLVATGNYSVAVNALTGRIRITSVSTGISSVVALGANTIGNSLTTLLTSYLAANNGENSLTATCAVDSTSGKIRITSTATGVTSDVTITEGTGTDNEHLVALLGAGTAVAGIDEVFESATDNILFKAKEKGSATNDISVVKSSRTNPVDSTTIHKIEVFYNGILKETFDEVSLTVTDTNFFVTKINADPSNGGSEWVTIEYEDNDANDLLAFANGTYYLGVNGGSENEYTDGDTIGQYDFRVGTNGIPTSGGSSLFVDALSVDGDLGNMEMFDYHILITPDNGAEATQGAAFTLAEYRKDFIYIADSPYGLEYDEVADWHNGVGGYGRNAAANTSYGATYWPWLKDYNSSIKEYVWCPPSVFVAEKYMEIDRLYGPWYAVAGDTRGKIIAYDYETSPSFAQREILYGDYNAVNPIVNFSSKGLEIYGQKTLLRQNSALNRVSVRRMVIYAKKLIKRAMEGIVFEPHNADSWGRATNMINSILEPIRQANGLSNYRVTIDSSTNTPDVIDQGIMKGIIKLVPVGTIEIIDLTISILNPGAVING